MSRTFQDILLRLSPCSSVGTKPGIPSLDILERALEESIRVVCILALEDRDWSKLNVVKIYKIIHFQFFRQMFKNSFDLYLLSLRITV
jgi:hypothetical protein